MSFLQNIDLTIVAHERKWYVAAADFEQYVEQVCLRTLKHQEKHLLKYCPNVASEAVGIALVFVDSQEVQKLNKQFRGKDAPTNVLSFAADMEGLQPENQEIVLGDVIFAYEVIEAEAAEQGKDFIAHLTHMIVHGLLHLLGFDHMSESDAEIMERIEIDILQSFDIANPYIIDNSGDKINQLHGT
jgi:probable rRNA maturation factor